MPWVGLEHFGSNWLTASELDRLLAEMQSQGATRYCYFIYNSMEPEIWNVIQKYARGRSYGSTLTRREGDTTN